MRFSSVKAVTLSLKKENIRLISLSTILFFTTTIDCSEQEAKTSATVSPSASHCQISVQRNALIDLVMLLRACNAYIAQYCSELFLLTASVLPSN